MPHYILSGKTLPTCILKCFNLLLSATFSVITNIFENFILKNGDQMKIEYSSTHLSIISFKYSNYHKQVKFKIDV